MHVREMVEDMFNIGFFYNKNGHQLAIFDHIAKQNDMLMLTIMSCPCPSMNIIGPYMPIPCVGLMVTVVGFGSEGPEFKSCSAVGLIPGGVNSACHLSEVSKMSASMLVSCVGVTTHPGLCPIAKETP